jgi:peptide methionine sulfoxide reductase msrA/msrB
MKLIPAFALFVVFNLMACSQNSINMNTSKSDMNFNSLTPEEERIIVFKGTEAPFSGKYVDFFENGNYTCKRCGAVLFNSNTKFESDCGWPSFDDAIPGTVKKTLDADGRRTEITCAHCGAHLGHVFTGEGFTPKDTRYCVNSLSLNFSPNDTKNKIETDTAIFAGGCFWGVEHYMEKATGVISAESGYIGGNIDNPTYEEVCSHTTGFAEAGRVIFDPKKTSFEILARLFFEIHDPTQVDRQGPDVGDQYRSAIFYLNEGQKQTSQKLVKLLEEKGYKVVTKLVPATKFWKAEDYHQDYYAKNGKSPYCHVYKKRF